MFKAFNDDKHCRLFIVANPFRSNVSWRSHIASLLHDALNSKIFSSIRFDLRRMHFVDCFGLLLSISKNDSFRFLFSLVSNCTRFTLPTRSIKGSYPLVYLLLACRICATSSITFCTALDRTLFATHPTMAWVSSEAPSW